MLKFPNGAAASKRKISLSITYAVTFREIFISICHYNPYYNAPSTAYKG